MTDLVITTGRRRTRRAGMFNAGALGALMVLLAFVALFNPPTTAPPIADLSPRADQSPDAAEQDVSSQFGQGDGECVPGQECAEGGSRGGGGFPSTTTLPTVIEGDEAGVPTVRRCIGDPPRQIEDPQSPPCAPLYKGPNPGATSRGVTANEIVVTVSYQGPNSVYRDIDKAFVAFFNRRFEFYGRQIVLKEAAGPDLAARVDEEFRAFAHSFTILPFRIDPEFGRRRIVTVINQGMETTDAAMGEAHRWSYHPSNDVIGRNMGEVYCKSLNGSRAEWAGPEVSLKARKLAVLAEIGSRTRNVTIAGVKDALARCAIEPLVIEYRSNQRETVILSLQENEITTVMLLEDSRNNLFVEASRRGYEPEWFIGTGNVNNEAYIGGDEQLAHLFAITARTRGDDVSKRAWFWAYDEARPDGPKTFDVDNAYYHEDRYHVWLVLASGLQQAGPRLTPETFALGLQRSRFPNPRAGAEPWWQGSVGFDQPVDHSFVNDFGLIWWDPSAGQTGYKSIRASGGFCNVEQGARSRAGTWPERRRALFERPCEQ